MKYTGRGPAAILGAALISTADNSFDVVMSCVGAMRAPHEATADELVRVVRLGGTIGMINWDASGVYRQSARHDDAVCATAATACQPRHRLISAFHDWPRFTASSPSTVGRVKELLARTSRQATDRRRSIMKNTFLKRVLAGTVLAATLGVPGIVGLTAATASAMPISTLASECRSAPKGQWITEYTAGRVTGYMCFYNDISGNRYVDFYDRYGNYKSSG
jgi:hypothetical protein